MGWIVYSKKPVVRGARPGQSHCGKPSGLWCSEDGYWKSWCNYEGWSPGVYRHKYKVHLLSPEILRLRTMGDIRDFNGEFLKKGPWSHENMPDWAKVAQQYAGVEVLKPGILEVHARWLWGWDLSSLCIWDDTEVELEVMDLDWDGSVPRFSWADEDDEDDED